MSGKRRREETDEGVHGVHSHYHEGRGCPQLPSPLLSRKPIVVGQRGSNAPHRTRALPFDQRVLKTLPISASNSVSRSFPPSLSPVLRRPPLFIPLLNPSSTFVYPPFTYPHSPTPTPPPARQDTKSTTVSPSSPGSTTTRTMNSSSCSPFSTHSAASTTYVPSRRPLPS